MELCKELLEILLHIKIDHLEKPQPEKTIQPEYDSKSIRLDVYVKDTDKVFDIEMQTGNYNDLLLRARYYQVGMDLGETPRCTKYKDLKETYIIFICKDDPFNIGCPVYTKKSIFEECPDFNYQDKTHFVVYNSSGYKKEKDKEVQSVLSFIYGLGPNSDFTDNLEEKVNELKQKKDLKEGYMRLYDVIEEEKEIAVKEAVTENSKVVKLQTLLELAKKMIKDGKLSTEDISKYSSLPLDQVNALAKELSKKSE